MIIKLLSRSFLFTKIYKEDFQDFQSSPNDQKTVGKSSNFNSSTEPFQGNKTILTLS